MNIGKSETVTMKSSVNPIWRCEAGLALQNCVRLDKKAGYMYLYMDQLLDVG